MSAKLYPASSRRPSWKREGGDATKEGEVLAPNCWPTLTELGVKAREGVEDSPNMDSESGEDAEFPKTIDDKFMANSWKFV